LETILVVETIAPISQRFVSAVRRRILLIRIGESIAVFTAGASILGLALLPIFWMRGESASPLTVEVLGGGIVLGFVHGIARRPSRLAAAQEADTQLNLHDLLGTVLSINQNTDETWQRSLVAFAEERCRTLRPSSVVVQRIGLRGWAGVGILGALLMASTLLTVRPTTVTAGSPLVTGDSAQSISAQIPGGQDSGISSASPLRPPGPGGTDAISDRGFDGDSQDGQTTTPGDSGHSSGGSSASSGAGVSTTANSIAPPAASSMSDTKGANLRTGKIVEGNGQGDSRIRAAGENNSMTAAPMPGNKVRSWESSGDTAIPDPSESGGDFNRSPDGDADLLRDYFKRN
jgi:hypothetical protein